ncbi:MAG: DUF1684 domain-containing protein [Rubricoccaceae bacterium]|nr:DUF1684 domain-containing protein [Rubricoccaceae bacterium]
MRALPLLALLLAACTVSDNDDARADWEAWRDDRLASLQTPDSWLALAGLYWLEPGTHTVGSDSANSVVFPPGAPARIGVVEVTDSTITMRPEPEAGVTLDGGEPVVGEVALVDDTEGAPTVARLGSLSWHAIRRSRGLGLRLRDAESPVLRQFDGIETFDYDPAWRVEARLDPYDPPRTLPIPSITGVPEEEVSPGALVFEHGGTEHRLDVTGAPGSERYFVVFGDATNGDETYGGGRFVYVDAPGADGRTVLDLNRAYNPPCVFTPYATCPLPPPQNRLPFRVEAGEKTWGNGH